MTLVALDGTPLLAVGVPQRQLYPALAALTATTLDATNEALEMVGQVFWEDGGTHTVDTSGSSSLGWRCASGLVFANGGTTVKVGLGAVNTTTGPPPRAANASDVITFDVNAAFTGGGAGITTAAWNESVPTAGSKVIAHGDFLAFAVQVTARAGADSLSVSCVPGISASTGHPTVTSYIGATYGNAGLLPNAVITASDGTRGYFYGGNVASTVTTQTWDNTSGTKEYGNLIELPFPSQAYGLIFNAAITGNTDAILYSDPLGTPVAENTVSIDLNTVGVNTAAAYAKLFPAPFTMAANTPYAAILKPTSASSISMLYKTFGNSAHQASESGSDGYAINRNTGAFASQNSNLDRYAIGILIGALDTGVGGGGGGAGVIG